MSDVSIYLTDFRGFSISNIAFYMIFGRQVVEWLGILAGVFLVLAVLTAFLNMRRIKFLNMKWHRRFGYLALLFGVMHGLLIFLI